MKKVFIFLLPLLALTSCERSDGEKIGEASTVFNLLGKNDRIEVESFSDPDVDGISCYLSYAKKGGAKELIGLEVDTSDASIACVQTAPVVKFREKAVLKPERIFRKRSSAIWKTLQVMRYYDENKKVFSYLVFSDEVIEGSPKNSLSAISCHSMPPINLPQSEGKIVGGCLIY